MISKGIPKRGWHPVDHGQGPKKRDFGSYNSPVARKEGRDGEAGITSLRYHLLSWEKQTEILTKERKKKREKMGPPTRCDFQKKKGLQEKH